MKEKEEWREIHDSKYMVSNLGRVKGPKGILKPYPNTSGRLQVRIYYTKGTPKKVFVAQLVAKAWIDNKQGYEFIHHKDERFANNRADNLEWVPTASHPEKRSPNRKRLNRERRKKDIAQIDADTGDIIRTWNRVKLKEKTSLYFPYILRACGSGQKYKGYKWKYSTRHIQRTLF